MGFEGAGNDIGDWFESAAFDSCDWIEGAFYDSGDWFEGAFIDYTDWFGENFLGYEPDCFDSVTDHGLNEAIPGKGHTTTKEMNLKMREKARDIDKKFYSFFGLDKNGKNRKITREKCLEVDCLHTCYMLDKEKTNPCKECMQNLLDDNRWSILDAKRWSSACDRCEIN